MIPKDYNKSDNSPKQLSLRNNLMTHYLPLGTKVLLKKLPKQAPKPGVILTINETPEKMISEIVEIGELCNILDLQWIGMKVRYAPYTAQMIDEDNPDFLIIDEKDIWCIIK